MTNSKRINPIIILWAVIALIVIIIAILTLNPGKASINLTKNEATILFSASRRWVISNGDCVTLSWKLDGIKSLYINGKGHVGEGEEDLCVENDIASSTLEVEFKDGTIENYTLSITTMANAPEIWFLGLIAFTLFLASIYLFLQPFLVPFKPAFRTISRWTLILSVNLLIALIIAEFGLRFYISNYGTEEDRGRYIYSLEQLRERSKLAVMPFLNYTINPSEANNLGYRNVEDTIVPKPAGVYRIVALGGSTTYGLGMAAPLAYPARLQQVLRKDYGLENVEVLNAGAISYTSWNSVVNLAFRVLEANPDLVIIYHGVNDVRARLNDPECYRGENIHRGIDPGAGILQEQAQSVSPSALYRYIGIKLGFVQDPVQLDNNMEIVIHCEPSTLDRTELMQINEPVYFERNLITMIGIARIHNIDIMLSTWTYNAEIPENVGPDWWKLGVQQNNDVTRKVASQEHTLFYDLEASPMSDNPDYWFGDYTHQSTRGALYQAKLYAEYLVNSGVIPTENN